MDTLIFDMDDTLVVEEASAEAAFRAACKFACQKVGVNPNQLYADIRECCRTLWHKSPARSYCLDVGISSWEGLWAQFIGDDENLHILAEWAPIYRQKSWQNALHRCGIKDDGTFAAELSQRYVGERRNRHIIYEDVLPALQNLKYNFKLGLLSNGSPDLQRAKLNGAGIAGFFDAVVISGEVGCGKPDAKIFKLILQRLGSTAGSAAMIGNSLKSDIAPALELGMAAVWVNRDGKIGKKSIVPNAELTNLAKLKEVLEQLH